MRTLITLSLALVTCVLTCACKDQGQVKNAKLAAIAKRMNKDPRGRAYLFKARAQVKARMLEERAELDTKPKFKPATFEDIVRELAERNGKLEARPLEPQKLLESSQKKAP